MTEFSFLKSIKILSTITHCTLSCRSKFIWLSFIFGSSFFLWNL